MKLIVIKLIKVYQLFSEWLWRTQPAGLVYPACRFWPTCSHYAVEVIENDGLIKGGRKAVGRVLKCNPLTRRADGLVI